MKLVLGLLLALLVFSGGFSLGFKQRQPATPLASPATVDIYFLKPDGVYKISSAKEGEELLVGGEFKNLRAAGGKLLVASDSALLSYDLTSGGSSVIEPVAATVSFGGVAVSLDKTKVAYTKNIEVGGAGFKNELWLYDLTSGQKQKLLQEPELGADPEGVYYTFALNGWLDNQRLLVGRAHKGVSFCPFTVGEDSQLPDNCADYAGNDEDLNTKVLAGDGETQYLIKPSNPDAVGSIQADIFAFNLSDETSKRLTHDATSVDTKENLRLSNAGRFLSWDSREISSQQTRAWLYDLKLNQYYPLGDNTASAVVIEN